MKTVSENIKNIKMIVKSMRNAVEGIEIVAISKTFGADLVFEALKCGITDIGESKIQEALPKFEALGDSLKGIKKHFIGHLQSNKAKKAVENFDLIQSLDSLGLAKEINRHSYNIGKKQNCLIEVKVSKEISKTGIAQQDIDGFYKECLNFPNILISGLMLIPPANEDIEAARPYFKEGFNVFNSLKSSFKNENFKVLSMGMSADFKIALEEGSNMIRIGSAIFGDRQYANQ